MRLACGCPCPHDIRSVHSCHGMTLVDTSDFPQQVNSCSACDQTDACSTSSTSIALLCETAAQLMNYLFASITEQHISPLQVKCSSIAQIACRHDHKFGVTERWCAGSHQLHRRGCLQLSHPSVCGPPEPSACARNRCSSRRRGCCHSRRGCRHSRGDCHHSRRLRCTCSMMHCLSNSAHPSAAGISPC